MNNIKWYHFCLIIIGLIMVNIVITSFKNNDVRTVSTVENPTEESRILWAYDNNHPDFSIPNRRQRVKVIDPVEEHFRNMKFEDGYFLQIQDDNTLLLKDGGKIVHVFNRSYEPNRNLFYVIDRDNY